MKVFAKNDPSLHLKLHENRLYGNTYMYKALLINLLARINLLLYDRSLQV